jgi:hypothetical protein
MLASQASVAVATKSSGIDPHGRTSFGADPRAVRQTDAGVARDSVALGDGSSSYWGGSQQPAGRSGLDYALTAVAAVMCGGSPGRDPHRADNRNRSN